MNTRFVVVLTLGLMAVLLFANGCAKQPQATPEATPTENVVVVVVTATTQATFAATETGEPTITPLATFTPLGLNSPTPTTRASATVAPAKTAANTPRAARTNSPVVINAAPTALPSQNKYQAPAIIGPAQGTTYNDGNGITFQFQAVGSLPSSVCYKVYVEMENPNANPGSVGDWWLIGCGDQSNAGAKLSFALTKFRSSPNNYLTIRDKAQNLAPAEMLIVRWSVRLVEDNGLGPDGVHHNVVPLSPESQGFDLNFRL